MTDRLFPLDDVPEVPLLREPLARRGAAQGSALDARFLNDYPLDWHRCTACGGRRKVSASLPTPLPIGGVMLTASGEYFEACPACLGMGSLKGRVRLEAGHRCERCQHPFVTRSDAKMLGVEPSSGHWSPCDERCVHRGPYRVMHLTQRERELYWFNVPGPDTLDAPVENWGLGSGGEKYWAVEAEWRVLTVHHLDGDKANCRWWNLAALCQRCHLEIQAKVVMERVYPHEHSAWFRPHAAGYYAWVYLCEDLSREETLARMDELLALELVPA